MKSAAAIEEASMESVVGRLAEEYTERINAGERPEIDRYVKRYPQYAEAIRHVLGALEAVRALSSDTAGWAGILDPDRSITGRLGDYRIIREVGRGGMGVVYEAEQILLGRRVALKVLPFAAVLDAKQLQRFKNEAQAAALLTQVEHF